MPAEVEVAPADPSSMAAMLDDYRGTLVAPMDDMWAAFAEKAHPFSMLAGGEPIGFFSVNDERELHRFYVRPALEHRADAFLRQVLTRRSICAAFPTTVDPAFTSLSMDLAQDVEVKALLFQHVVDPESIREPLATMRRAEEVDFEAAVAFEQAGTGGPLAFLRPYLTARIGARELLLHEVDGTIVGIGELRRDDTNPGYAHLGVIVGEALRGQGLGNAIMNYLVEEAGRHHMKPLCSTEPTNLAARRVIERAGFRARHRVFRVAFAQSAAD